jgi:hypothetical protein
MVAVARTFELDAAESAAVAAARHSSASRIS